MKKLTSILMSVCMLTAVCGLTGCGGGSEKSSSGSRICQFDGCEKRATNVTGEFCDFHDRILNEYWDSQY
ncbi:MAG: hypothetical protein NC177_01160 [Ruminococcus flavefaciens]|nr:hypothetical protein [Ruminococcus flavefaciens]